MSEMTTERKECKVIEILKFVSSSGWNLVCTLLLVMVVADGIKVIIYAIGELWG